MRHLTLRSLWEHKRRLVSTALAVLLGVAFMSGTLVLSDTLNRVFDDLFADGTAGIDAQVQGTKLFDSQFGGELRGRLDASLVDTVRRVDGVAAAEPYVTSVTGSLLGANGKVVGGQGPPTFFESWIADEALNAFDVREGRAPAADDEVALDRAAADAGDLRLAGPVVLLSQAGRKEYKLVGITSFGKADSAAGSIGVEMTLAEAQRLAGAEGKLDSIFVRAVDGVSPETLVERVRQTLPANAEAITGEQAAADQAAGVKAGFGFLSNLLLVFAGIALFVGIFIIYNTFSILVAQRTREMALLRAIGASRPQVLRSVLLEAVVIGLVASVLGLLAGVALAIGVQALLAAIGVDLPTGATVVRPATVVTAFVVGLSVTVAAAVFPAIRATRVAPLAALRDVAIDRSSASKARVAVGVLLLLVGVAGILPAFADDPDTDRLPVVGLGAALVLVSLLVIGPVLARPLALVLGAGLPRLRGASGRLARDNAVRSPKRTAATASALMIGVALVGFLTVFAASAKASITGQVDRGFRGAFFVQPANAFTFGGLSPQVARDLDASGLTRTVSSIRTGEAQIVVPNGKESRTFVGGVDPATFGQVFEVKMTQGSLQALTDGGVAVDQKVAADLGVTVGDKVAATFPGGASAEVTIQALSDEPTLLNPWTLTTAKFASLAAEQLDTSIGITLAEGVSAADARPELERLLEPYPTARLLDRQELIGSLAGQITGVLNIMYGLLGLSILIAMIGIANTLSLSVHERTHELGLLRAVGMTRSQLRSSIRWESVIVALIGTTLGLLLGVGLSYTMVRALSGAGFSEFRLPVGSLVVVVVLGAGLGMLASLRPATRAAKLNVLAAIASD